MNKAITDGLALMPPPFAAGLDQWSSGDGTPGAPGYDGAPNAAFVPADQDFGGALELLKTQSVQKLRYFGETPILPGCYLRVRVRIKAISGNLPSVRIAGWAGAAGGGHVAGLPETAAAVALTTYGEVVTLEAIVGSGARTGVDMVWGMAPAFGHFGLDLTGPDGGVVRIDDVEIEDVTAVFHRKMMDWVDVRDYGALGDGLADDRDAFVAADAAAAGRAVLVPAGSFRIATSLSMDAPMRFVGALNMPADARLELNRGFDFPTYAAAFGDEAEGLRRGLQALFNATDHQTFDLRGRRVQLAAPLDVHAAVGNKDSFAVRRGLSNGQIELIADTAWDTGAVTSQASYSPGQPLLLSGVANVANIPVGALVEGAGVGREVYVSARNVGAGTLTLSQPLYDATGTQTFTFRRFRHALDFSGFTSLSSFEITNIEFLCKGIGSAIMLAPDGLTFRLADCVISKPKDRGVTSIGRGCQGMFLDRCQFLSNEQPQPAQARTTIAFNVNANDVKVRDCRAVRFLHFGVMGGGGHILSGNHFFQGDEENLALRTAGIVLTSPNPRVTISGNYIDNCWIEWGNEHDEAPDQAAEFSFGALTITANNFVSTNVAPWFRWIKVRPYGPGHFIQGLSVTGNVFRTINGNIDRIEEVDEAIAGLDLTRLRNIVFLGNTFNGITQITQNPVTLIHDQPGEAATWTHAPGPFLPFAGLVRTVEAVVAEGPITDASGTNRHEAPFVRVRQGVDERQATLHWPAPVKGQVQVTSRVDAPF